MRRLIAVVLLAFPVLGIAKRAAWPGVPAPERSGRSTPHVEENSPKRFAGTLDGPTPIKFESTCDPKKCISIIIMRGDTMTSTREYLANDEVVHIRCNKHVYTAEDLEALVDFLYAFPASPGMSKPFEMLNRFTNYLSAAPVGATLEDRDLKKSDRLPEEPPRPSGGLSGQKLVG